MNALVWASQVSASAKRAGVRLQSQRRDIRQPRFTEVNLTETDRKLISLVSQGLSNRQISQLLHYSPKTVEIYLSRLYRKVGITSRYELIATTQREQIGDGL
jgi:DNA-binding NarL/FixJ family response regulator